MRTTKAQERALFREARQALGVRMNRDVWGALAPIQEQIKAEVNARSGDRLSFYNISCYADGAWTVNYVANGGQPGSALFLSVYPGIEKIVRDPIGVVSDVLEHAKNRGILREAEETPEAPAP